MDTITASDYTACGLIQQDQWKKFKKRLQFEQKDVGNVGALFATGMQGKTKDQEEEEQKNSGLMRGMSKKIRADLNMHEDEDEAAGD